LLCGIKQEPPGPATPFTGELRLPTIPDQGERILARCEHSFLDAVFNLLENGQPLMILAQADTHTQTYGQALRQRAETRFGADNVYHCFPPNSVRADSAAYFGRLAKQCRFTETVTESWQWAECLAQKLETSQSVLLLVTGFENGAHESRAELAGELRQFNERYPGLRLVMMGGERLATLKYAQGSMSLLNTAQELTIPALDHRDLPEIFGQLYPHLALTTEQLQTVLEFTGCHPRLMHYCLQQGADSAQACEQLLRQSPLPAQLYTGFRSDHDRIAICDLLQQTKLGRYDPWPADELLRKLYWSNLITRRGQDLCWRCEFIRQVGLEILPCD
jgi:hypothetical protein